MTAFAQSVHHSSTLVRAPGARQQPAPTKPISSIAHAPALSANNAVPLTLVAASAAVIETNQPAVAAAAELAPAAAAAAPKAAPKNARQQVADMLLSWDRYM